MTYWCRRCLDLRRMFYWYYIHLQMDGILSTHHSKNDGDGGYLPLVNFLSPAPKPLAGGVKKFSPENFFLLQMIWNGKKLGQIKDQGSISRTILGQFVLVPAVQSEMSSSAQLYVSLFTISFKGYVKVAEDLKHLCFLAVQDSSIK